MYLDLFINKQSRTDDSVLATKALDNFVRGTVKIKISSTSQEVSVNEISFPKMSLRIRKKHVSHETLESLARIPGSIRVSKRIGIYNPDERFNAVAFIEDGEAMDFWED